MRGGVTIYIYIYPVARWAFPATVPSICAWGLVWMINGRSWLLVDHKLWTVVLSCFAVRTISVQLDMHMVSVHFPESSVYFHTASAVRRQLAFYGDRYVPLRCGKRSRSGARAFWAPFLMPNGLHFGTFGGQNLEILGSWGLRGASGSHVGTHGWPEGRK